MDANETIKALKAVAAARRIDFALVGQRYCQERFLARLADRFGHEIVLKGGMLAFLFEGTDPLGGRTTKDVDIASPTWKEAFEPFAERVWAELQRDVGDGVTFENMRITKTRPAEGDVRGGSLKVSARIGGAKFAVEMDATFDARATIEDCDPLAYPSVLGGTGFTLMRYPDHCVLGDKFAAMARHGAGALTYRMRDFYDAWLLIAEDRVEIRDVAAAYLRTMDLFDSDPDLLLAAGALDNLAASKRGRAWDQERKTRNLVAEVPPFASMVEELRSYAEDMMHEVYVLQDDRKVA